VWKAFALALALVFAWSVARAAPGVAGMEHVRSGLASWYSLPGHRMANGCRFHVDHLSAASRTLALGSWAKVRRGHRSVLVEITDRGPYTGGRVLDLSRAAAAQLDMIAAGIVMVSIEPIRVPPGPHCPDCAQPGAGWCEACHGRMRAGARLECSHVL
jgi:rare lipoprotein A